jgi:hypothetical protein
METLEAAVYRTRGGKFVTTLSKYRDDPFAKAVAALAVSPFESDESEPGRPTTGYNKAGVHDSIEAAMDWFKPGRLTDEIRRKLGLDEPVRIE